MNDAHPQRARTTLPTRRRMPKRIGFLLLAAVFCLPAIFCPPQSARAEDPRDRRDAERDITTQQHVEQQLLDLQESMTALADELQATGHTYEAGLIRSGLVHLGKSDVTTAISSVLAALRSAQPETALEQSQRVLESLHRLLLILEDRDREFTRGEIMKRLEAAERAAAQAQELADQEAELQRKIDQAVSEARTDAARQAEALRQEASRLREEQAALRERMTAGANTAEDLEARMEALRALRENRAPLRT